MSINSRTTREIYKNINEIKNILSEPKQNITQTQNYVYIPTNQLYTSTPINLNQTKELLSNNNPNQINNQNEKLYQNYNERNNNLNTNENFFEENNNQILNSQNENKTIENINAINEKKMKKIAKNEFENLIIPFKSDFNNNLKKQKNFILKEEFQNELNDINKQLNSINNNIKELKNSIDNIYRLNEQFVTKNEHNESINNLLTKITELEKNINDNKYYLEKKCDENI